jgi:hypothetical protein
VEISIDDQLFKIKNLTNYIIDASIANLKMLNQDIKFAIINSSDKTIGELERSIGPTYP